VRQHIAVAEGTQKRISSSRRNRWAFTISGGHPFPTYEQRVDAIDAAAESYRKTALAFLSEEETKTERWLRDVLLRLRVEFAKRVRSSG
jgi:hypothetical protein